MKTAITNIQDILEKQIEVLKQKASKGSLLSVEDVDRLSTLSDIAVKIHEKVKFPKQKPRPRGYQASDERLVKLAKKKDK